MLDWLNFHLGEIIGLIHALEKSYYQNKTQLGYNFGSVYFGYWFSVTQTLTCNYVYKSVTYMLWSSDFALCL